MRREYAGVLTAIRETRELTDDNVEKLKEAIDRFRRGFEVTGGQLLAADEEPTEAGGEAGQESVARYNEPARTDGE
jgi:F-type H+/Na+-transporting ATPase subunit alpha